MALVSAVVSAHNEEEHIAGCLESIMSQTAPIDEIIVINDRSTDRTVAIATEYPVDIYDVEYGNTYLVKRTGICVAMNDTVLSIDGDTRIAPDFLERGIRRLEEGYDVASGKVYSQGRTPLGDFAAWMCNILPKSLWSSGPAYVLNRRAYIDVCKVKRINGFVDVCVGEDEIPIQRMSLIKDPDMVLWTDLPSTGQKRMILGARVSMAAITALRLLP